MRSLIAAPLLAALLATAPGPRPATAAAPQHVRGPIESVTPDGIVVNDRNGVRVDIQLADPLTVLVARPANRGVLEAGRGVAVVTEAARDGSLHALQILTLPDSVVVSRDSAVTWDMKPPQIMVAGRIVERSDRNGALRQLTVTNRDSTKVLNVTPATTVANLTAATRADLKAGETVFLSGPLTPDGAVTANRVIINPEAIGPAM